MQLQWELLIFLYKITHIAHYGLPQNAGVERASGFFVIWLTCKMAHTLIVGITGAGKTLLSQRLARTYKAKGISLLVLDPFQSKNWGADYITDNPENFLSTVFSYRSCAVFIDESGDMIGRWGGVMNQLATRSRQYGHNVHFIVQRPKMIDITVRTQCTNLFLFKLSQYDAKELSKEFVSDEILKSAELCSGEFIAKIGIDGKIQRGRIF